MRCRAALSIIAAMVVLAFGTQSVAAELVYDDFNDGNLGTNTGGGCGAMSPGGLYDPIMRFETDAREGPYSLSLTYNFPQGQWCGYWSAFRAGQTAYDVSSYDCIEMWVKGENGGEKFKVELADVDFNPENYLETQYHKMAIRIVDSPDGAFQLGLSTQWKKLSLPLSAFMASPSQIDLSRLKQVNIVFDEYPRSGKIYIDAIKFVTYSSILSVVPSAQNVSTDENFTISVEIVPGRRVDFIQFDLHYDPSIPLVLVSEGDYENGEISSFLWENRAPGYIRFTITGGVHGISARRTLAVVKFRALGEPLTTSISLENCTVAQISEGEETRMPVEAENGEVVIRYYERWDVNKDDNVDILDLAFVAVNWGKSGIPRWIRADVNGDGQIDICDLVLVAQKIGG